ncbi:MAG: formimidoylglutamate deiminase [Mariniblastus sp.]
MSGPKMYHFKSALVEIDSQASWRECVTLTIDEGVVSKIAFDAPVANDVQTVPGVVVPAIANVHSHAFQRGFAGLSEYRTAANDSFWTWRKLMYGFVNQISPVDVYTIARQVYLEMLEFGYSWVGEFHYLHKSENGAAYSNPAEMSDAVLRAADDVGIGICLIPVLYQRSGFDSNSVNEGQKRFSLSDDEFFELLDGCKKKITGNRNACLGMAAHSLRAVSGNALARALEFRDEFLTECPFHIHVAEQTKEIEDCLATTGMRSVQYLMENAEVDQNWCLIHATHISDTEIHSIVDSGATVGLCPTTEANLGDGIFPADRCLNAGGAISIGSDSHCSVDARDEMRTLEYGQRLRDRQRAILGSDVQSVGRRIFENCAEGGGKAIGVSTGKIAIGSRADLLVIDDQHPVIAGAQEDRLLDRFIFSNQGNPIAGRMVGGSWIDSDAFEAKKAKSAEAFLELNRRLLNTIK